MDSFQVPPPKIRFFKIYLVKVVIFHKGRKYTYSKCAKSERQLIKEEIAEDLFQSSQIPPLLVHQGQRKTLKLFSFSENMFSKHVFKSVYSGVYLGLYFKTQYINLFMSAYQFSQYVSYQFQRQDFKGFSFMISILLLWCST